MGKKKPTSQSKQETPSKSNEETTSKKETKKTRCSVPSDIWTSFRDYCASLNSTPREILEKIGKTIQLVENGEILLPKNVKQPIDNQPTQPMDINVMQNFLLGTSPACDNGTLPPSSTLFNSSANVDELLENCNLLNPKLDEIMIDEPDDVQCQQPQLMTKNAIFAEQTRTFPSTPPLFTWSESRKHLDPMEGAFSGLPPPPIAPATVVEGPKQESPVPQFLMPSSLPRQLYSFKRTSNEKHPTVPWEDLQSTSYAKAEFLKMLNEAKQTQNFLFKSPEKVVARIRNNFHHELHQAQKFAAPSASQKRLSLLETCSLFEKLDVNDKDIKAMYSTIGYALAERGEVEVFRKMIQNRVTRLFLEPAADEQKEFSKEFDGALLDFKNSVYLACLLWENAKRKVEEGSAEPISIESAKSDVEKNCLKYNVSLDKFFENIETKKQNLPGEAITDDNKKVYSLRLSMDGRKLASGLVQVLVGLVPLIPWKDKETQQPANYVPIMIINAKESKSLYNCIQKYLKERLKTVAASLNEELGDIHIDWYLSCDLRTLWFISGRHWSLNINSPSKFCLWCNATNANCHQFEYWSEKMASVLQKWWDIPISNILMCTLHAALRITERLLLWLFSKSSKHNTFQNLVEKIRTEANWEGFCVEEGNGGKLRIGGWISMAKIQRLMAVREAIVNTAFGLKESTKVTEESNNNKESSPEKVQKSPTPAKAAKNPKKPGRANRNVPVLKAIEVENPPVTKPASITSTGSTDIQSKSAAAPIESNGTAPATSTPIAPSIALAETHSDSQGAPAPGTQDSAKEQMEDEVLDINFDESDNELDMAQVNLEIAEATPEQFKALFNSWANILCVIDFKMPSIEGFVDFYKAQIDKFISSLRAVFGDIPDEERTLLSTKKIGSSWVVPYIHILCSHSVNMMSQNGLWLFSQQGFEHAHKLHKRIYNRHTMRGGGTPYKDPNVKILEITVIRIFYSLHEGKLWGILDKSPVDCLLTARKKKVEKKKKELAATVELFAPPTTPATNFSAQKDTEQARRVIQGALNLQLQIKDPRSRGVFHTELISPIPEENPPKPQRKTKAAGNQLSGKKTKKEVNAKNAQDSKKQKFQSSTIPVSLPQSSTNAQDSKKQKFQSSTNAAVSLPQRSTIPAASKIDKIQPPKAFLPAASIKIDLSQNRYVGLPNLGGTKTCYANAILQCMFQIKQISNYFCQEFDSAHLTDKQQEAQTCAKFAQLVQFHRSLTPQTSRFQNTDEKLRLLLAQLICGIMPGPLKQEDAHEFLGALVDHFREGINTKNSIFTTFNVTLIVEKKCGECGTIDHAKYEQLQWHIPVAGKFLSDCFQEPVTADRNFSCSGCGKPQKSGITTVEIFPEVLVIVLMRYNIVHDDYVKNKNPIIPAQYLIFRGGIQYELLGIVVHHGESRKFGHYISYVNCEGEWIRFDDISCTSVEFDKVLKDGTNNGYIFFYKKRETLLPQKFNLKLSEKEVEIVSENKWLNDEIINYFLFSLTHNNDKFVAVSTFFFSTLQSKYPAFEDCWRITHTITDLFNKILFVPINWEQNHWILAVVNFSKKEVMILDSLSGSSHDKIKSLLRWFVENEAKSRKVLFDTTQWSFTSSSCPQQQNFVDCGIFVCRFAKAILENAGECNFNFSQADVPRIREELAKDLKSVLADVAPHHFAQQICL